MAYFEEKQLRVTTAITAKRKCKYQQLLQKINRLATEQHKTGKEFK